MKKGAFYFVCFLGCSFVACGDLVEDNVDQSTKTNESSNKDIDFQGDCSDMLSKHTPRKNHIWHDSLYEQVYSPKEFLLYLSECRPTCSFFTVDTKSVSKEWVGKEDVFALADFLDCSNKCTEVHNALHSRVYEKYTSTVGDEALKLINIYFSGAYLTSLKKSKEEVKLWVDENR